MRKIKLLIVGSFPANDSSIVGGIRTSCDLISNYAFKDGFIVAGTSPKAWIFFPLIFPQFINFNENYISQFIILIITYMILDFISLIGYAILAKKLLHWINANPRIISSISACVLILIAIFIGFTQNY